MALLEKFLLEFISDGLSELPKEVDEADNSLDEFEDTAKDAEKATADLNKKVKESKKEFNNLDESIKKTDKTTKKLNKSITSSLANVKSLALQATRTIAPFVLLGKAISDTVSFASGALEAAEAAEKAGMTLEQFQSQDGNKYKLYTKEDVNNAKEYEMTMRDIRMGTAVIGAEISRMLLPAVTALAKVVKQVVDFFIEHGTFIKTLFIGFATAITIAAIPAIINMGVALWGALAPILPILIAVTAAIVGIALIVEDFYKWVHGEPSVAELIFGPFEDYRNKILKGFEEIKEAFDKGLIPGIVTAFQKLFSMLGQMFTNFYNEIWTKMPAWLRTLLGTGNPIGMALNIKTLFDRKPDGSHAAGLNYVPFDGYLAELHKGERVQTASEAQDWRSGLLAAKRAINFTANYPLNAIPSGALTNAYNNSLSNSYDNSNTARSITIGDITIQTQATDAQGIATDLASYIKQAVISLDDGMLA